MKARNIVILLLIFAVLGGTYYVVSRPKPGPPPEPKMYVWDIQQEDIERITITLPREPGAPSQSWIDIPQEDKFPWYFDDANRSAVDTKRWGGGIPLLLSGPGADRVIAENATQEKLEEYGLLNPSMVIKLEMFNGQTMNITVGDRTPNGNNYYVRAPSTNAVATVDYTWYDVLSKLVTDPPYAAPSPTPLK